MNLDEPERPVAKTLEELRAAAWIMQAPLWAILAAKVDREAFRRLAQTADSESTKAE